MQDKPSCVSEPRAPSASKFRRRYPIALGLDLEVLESADWLRRHSSRSVRVRFTAADGKPSVLCRLYVLNPTYQNVRVRRHSHTRRLNENPQDSEMSMDGPNAEEKTTKRDIGRPIIYHGDPLSPDVTLEQRRLISRRIVNRESARRVRGRRHEVLDRLAQKADYLEQTNAILCQKLEKVQGHGTELEKYLEQLNKNILAKERENADLCNSIALMREREVTPHPRQMSFGKLVPNLSSFDPCTEFPLQPDTCNTIDASIASWLDVKHSFAKDGEWLDGEWLACLDDVANGLALSTSSFFMG